MTFSKVIGFIVGAGADIAILAFMARRLLGEQRISLTRTVIAGLAGILAANAILNALLAGRQQHIQPAIVVCFLVLAVAIALLVAMTILVIWQAFIPAGSVPPPTSWPRLARGRIRRSRRYWQIVRIFTKAGFSARAGLGSRTARSLSLALERSGVVFIKFGQALSTRRDLLPAELAAELGRLQDRVSPLPWEQIALVLRQEQLDDAFAAIDREPLAAASIAQVHAATLRTGERVVIKVRRPDVADIAERDLDIIHRLARTLDARASWARSLGVISLADGFAVALREELDFRVEAGNLAAVSGHPDASVVIPAAHADLSSKRVLVMERLDGVAVSKPGALDGHGDREQLARDLLGTVLHQIVMDGVFHADPHPGNILLLGDGRLGLIDFGSVGRLDSGLRAALQRLLLGLDRRDPVAVTDALLEVTARPDELDEQGMERAVGGLMAKLGRGRSPDAAMFTDLFKIVARHQLAIPPEFAAVFRALSTLEGGLTLIAPGFDIVTEAEHFGREQMRPDPQTIQSVVAEEAMALVPILRRLPRRIDRITAAAEGGRLSLNVRLFADERERRTVTGWLQQLVITVLAATAGLMAVILLAIRGGPVMTPGVGLYQFLGYCLLVISSLLALRALAAVFRNGSR